MYHRILKIVVFYILSSTALTLASTQNRPALISFRRQQPTLDHGTLLSLRFIGNRLPHLAEPRIFEVLSKFVMTPSGTPSSYKRNDDNFTKKSNDFDVTCLNSITVKCNGRAIPNITSQDRLVEPLQEEINTTTTEGSSDITTEVTDEYETTTAEYDELNRIANPSHVLASLVG